MDETALSATDVHARYESKAGENDAVVGVTLSIAPGDLVCVLGPNGAGKSTLVRVLAGTLAPTRGSVALFGRPIGSIDRREVARAVAVVPQQTEVAWGFAVRDVVMMG